MRNERAEQGPLPVDYLTTFVIELLSPVMHYKRALSLAQAAVGTMNASRLTICDVGRSLARVYGIKGKNGIKQVDRLLSNDKIDVDRIFAQSVPWLVGKRERIVVTMDWTEYAKDGHSRVSLNLVTNHGRRHLLFGRRFVRIS